MVDHVPTRPVVAPVRARVVLRSAARRRADALRVAGTVVAGLAAIAVLFPFAMMISASLMTLREAFTFPPRLLPETPRPANYLDAWTGAPFARYFVNTLVVAGVITAGQTVTSVLAAYAFARMRFPGRDGFFALFVATLMIPGHVVLIPNYLTLARFDLINTYAALVLPFLASGFSVFLIRQHFRTIPGELEDAARIDGASAWVILWRIFVPLGRPAIATAALFTFLSEWNAYLWPLIVTDSDRMRTVQIGLRSFLAISEEEGLTNWPVVLAAAVLVLLPSLVAFALAERQLVKGITLSGLKG